MAIITRGKIRGRVGRVVYRVMGEKEIIQSFPRPPKGGYPEREQNKRFRMATAVASNFYRQLKDFGCNAVDSRLYNSMTRYFMSHYAENPSHRNEAEGDSSDSNAWMPVQGDGRLVMSKNGRLRDFLYGMPTMKISEGTYTVSLPGFPAYKERLTYAHPIIHEAEAIELAFMLLHYDPVAENLEIIGQWVSGRLVRSKSIPPQVLKNTLITSSGDPIDRGVLLGSFGIRFFVTEASNTYLNNEKYNPAEILGVWIK